MFNVNANKIKAKMTSFKRKRVWSLDELFNITSEILHIDVNDIKNKYYLDFYNLIREMEYNNIIKNYGNEQNFVQPRLYRKYKLITETDNLTDDDKIRIIALNKLNLSYYQKKATEFKEDYDTLVVLNDYMRNKDKYKNLSLNEISYELFGYEKAMIKDEEPEIVSNVMSKIGLNQDNIGCRVKLSPLLNTIYRNFYQKKEKNILIVENLETYWTLNRYLRETATPIDMLVFGEGYSITKNFEGIIQYGVNKDDNILYYGDIDLEGICIYALLKEKFADFTIQPYVPLYKRLLKSGLQKGVNKSISPNQNKPDDDDMKEFLSWFNDKEQYELENILINRLYIPQESLNYEKLRGDTIE